MKLGNGMDFANAMFKKNTGKSLHQQKKENSLLKHGKENGVKVDGARSKKLKEQMKNESCSHM